MVQLATSFTVTIGQKIIHIPLSIFQILISVNSLLRVAKNFHKFPALVEGTTRIGKTHHILIYYFDVLSSGFYLTYLRIKPIKHPKFKTIKKSSIVTLFPSFLFFDLKDNKESNFFNKMKMMKIPVFYIYRL